MPKILATIQSGAEIEFCRLPEDAPKARQADISRAKTMPRWKLRLKFEDGITAAIEYFRGFVGIGVE